MTASPRFIIIGAGHAGGRAAEAMRALGFAGRILLIGEEPHLPYERPPLSKELLQGKADMFSPIRPAEFWKEKEIELRLGMRAAAIDPAAKTVTLADGAVEPYDKLLLATGGAVRRLPLPGADLGNVFYLRTLDDSRAIEARLTPAAGYARPPSTEDRRATTRAPAAGYARPPSTEDRRATTRAPAAGYARPPSTEDRRATTRAPNAKVIVIGGGFIGLETAASARLRGCAVTVIELADRLMARCVPPEISQTFLDLHRKQGVDIRLGAGVARIEGTDRVARVITSDGEALDADLVVVGVGIVPDTGLAQAAGLAVADGIVVDEYCRTSAPDVFAAGDVTSHFSPVYGRHIRLESWQNAQNQAIAAARVMCGEETPYAEVPWMWSDQFDAKLEVAGMPTEWDAVVMRGDPASGAYMLFQLSGGRPVGAMSVSLPRDMRFARRLLQAGKPVDAAALADESVSMRELAR